MSELEIIGALFVSLILFLVAAIVSFFAVKWLLRYVQTHTFTAFGWYRVALAAFLALLLFIGGSN